MRLPIKVISAGIAIVLVLGLIVILYTNYSQYPTQDFCSLNDEVYQTIVSHVDEWINTMRERITSNDIGWSELSFSVPSGRTYTVSASNRESYQSTLLITLKHSWNERLGFMGYVYSHADAPSLEDKYEVKYLDNDIYCYNRKQGYE